MGSTPKPMSPAQQAGSGIAGMAAGATNVASAPNAIKPMPTPQSYIPIQQPPAEEAPMMPLSSPSLAVPFAPNSSNPLGVATAPDPRAQILKTLFSRMGGR